MNLEEATFVNKEISWLEFNDRVLQEAQDESVPIIERVKFLGIFSSNLDEFFRVRVATLKRLVPLGKKAEKWIGGMPESILQEIGKLTLQQQKRFDQTYRQILTALKRKGIEIIDDRKLNSSQKDFCIQYFRDNVRPFLFPIVLSSTVLPPTLNEASVYLAVTMKKGKDIVDYSIIEIPCPPLSRFIIIPGLGRKRTILLLDDLIRLNLKEVFSSLDYTSFDAHTIKITRDAELDIEGEMSDSLFKKVSRSLHRRKSGAPVRFIYDEQMPQDKLDVITKFFGVHTARNTLVPGSRYHNFKDFVNFPKLNNKSLYYPNHSTLPHPSLEGQANLFKVFREQDILVHYPYQSFDYVIDFLREASINKNVTHIQLTSYRLAKHSKIVNAIINAARNGILVTVILELQARFDEEANLHWSSILTEEGIRVIHGVPNLKVHGKMILITEKERTKTIQYGYISTGNLHEGTSKLYTDHGLFTTDPRITRDMQTVFTFFDHNYKVGKYHNLIVSPFHSRKKLIHLINQEIKHAKNGSEALIILKLNNLTDPKLLKRLYHAGKMGVEVRLMVRGMFSLKPMKRGYQGNLKTKAIIDRYLEHSRIFYFHNAGDTKLFISSADWMPRNMDGRVEVSCPIFDKHLQSQLKTVLDIEWQDNQKSRILFEGQQVTTSGSKKTVRSQNEVRQYLQLQQ